MSDNKMSTGAIRSSDVDHLDFTSMPLIGLLGVARTTFEGGTKYGRFNYMKGMPAHVCINHALVHLIRFAMGDRSQPHLEHAAWNCMAACQSVTLNPELNAPHLPGPGYTLTSAILDHLDAGNDERAEKRKSGEFDALGNWILTEMPEVAELLAQRKAETEKKTGPSAEWRKLFTGAVKKHKATQSTHYGQGVPVDGMTIAPIKCPAGEFPPGLHVYLQGKLNPRYEAAIGPAWPLNGETWCEYEGGHRIYWTIASAAPPNGNPVEPAVNMSYAAVVAQHGQQYADLSIFDDKGFVRGPYTNDDWRLTKIK